MSPRLMAIALRYRTRRHRTRHTPVIRQAERCNLRQVQIEPDYVASALPRVAAGRDARVKRAAQPAEVSVRADAQ